jgi:hypothetical protein
MVRVGGTDLTATGFVSVVIRREFYLASLLEKVEHPRFNAEDRTNGDGSIPVGVHRASLDHFRQLSEAFPGISLTQHGRTSQALRRNGHPTRSFPC